MSRQQYEAYLETRRNERYEDDTCRCYHCGEECSGDTTETVTIYDDVTAEKAVCDDPDNCPANISNPYDCNCDVCSTKPSHSSSCFCVLCLGGKK